LASGGDNTLLSDLGAWFYGIGTAVQSVGLATFRLAAGSLLVLGAVVVAGLSYRLAVRRFDQYSPP